LAQEEGSVAGAASDRPDIIFYCWIFTLVGALAALVQARLFYERMIRSDEGTERMREIAGYVRAGANAYLAQQFKVVTLFFVLVAAVLAWLAFGLRVQSEFVPFAFLTGGFFSGLAGWFGMKTATAASNRTAAAAEKSLNQGLQVAFRSGAVMGLTVVGLALLDISIWFCYLYWIWPATQDAQIAPMIIAVTMLSFGMGASSQALFARVGGGIFTKAADVGADLVGKVEQGIPEDDPRNPATIADNVGDNVGDVAGMGADLYESYAGSILASSALGAAAFASATLLPDGMDAVEAQLRAMLLPMTIASAGILLSILGIYLVRTREDASQRNLLGALARGINLSTVLVVVATLVLAKWLMPDVEGTRAFGLPIPGVALSVVVGLLAGWIIGKWTEYVTSDEFKPTRKLTEQAETGPATIIIGGIADGMLSVWVPVLTVGAAMIAAFGFAIGWNFADLNYFSLGLYGVGIAAVGMLSTLGITLATDAYGPIADNAGGNAEMAGLPQHVRERTDALDSLGNTTAATGKGFAIGSAALTALALLAAYVEGVRGGFDLWGTSAIEEMGSDAKPGLYKLSPGFVVFYEGNEPAAGGGTQRIVEKYLALPRDTRDERVRDAWQAIDFSRGPARIDFSPAGVIEIEHHHDEHTADSEHESEEHAADHEHAHAAEHVIAFRATGARLVNVQDAALSDFMAYYEANLMNPKVLVGIFLGAMAVFIFCAMTMKAVGRAAKGMVEEVRRQFHENKGIIEGTSLPDYAAPVEISTRAAQREMILPSLLGLSLPLAVGCVLGVTGVLGLLVGTLTTGFCLAVYMANSGGAWDNAKKHIEARTHEGKGSLAHKAAVVGDTVGDPFKDTSGPSLNILIKLMSMVSVVIAGLVVRYSLVSGGIF
jgi:inorganic pyrophosphatase/K(+)-stimulated pyrophosphate-energized sodium pump